MGNNLWFAVTISHQYTAERHGWGCSVPRCAPTKLIGSICSTNAVVHLNVRLYRVRAVAEEITIRQEDATFKGEDNGGSAELHQPKLLALDNNFVYSPSGAVASLQKNRADASGTDRMRHASAPVRHR